MILQLQYTEQLNCKIGRRWANIKGYEEFYQVSDDGIVRSLNRKTQIASTMVCMYGKTLKLVPHRRSGICVNLHGENGKKRIVQVSRLVAEHFIPNPNNKECVLHLDKDATNNTTNNLKWATLQECLKHGKQRKGEDKIGSKLNNKNVLNARNRFKNGEAISKLSSEYGVTKTTMRNVLQYKTWKHIN